MMAEQQAGWDGRIERRSAPRRVTTQANLRWRLAVAEGGFAALALLAPAIIYHQLAYGFALPGGSSLLYTGFALVVGAAYGTSAFLTAGRMLERSHHPHAIVADSALGWTVACSIALFVTFLLGLADELSRASITIAFVAGLPSLLVVRNVAYAGLLARVRSGRLQYQKVTVVGRGDDMHRFLRNGGLWKTGYQLAGTLEMDLGNTDSASRPDVVGFAQAWLAQGCETMVIVGDLGNIDALDRLVSELKRFAINVVCAPATENTGFKFLDVVPIGPNNALRFLRKPMSDVAVLGKRLFDLAGAGVGVVLLSPLLAVVALLIKLDSPGPVFFRQERRGFNGEIFHIWKFRSMRVTESGHKMTQVRVGDSRITKIGRFIRSTSIDELPQLFNVLRGEMSLVGPRPHAVVHDDELGRQVATYAYRQRIKPGITGWAQVNGFRGETSTLAQVEGRTWHDLYYIDNWSIFFDVWIVLLTVLSPKTRQNAV